jgi:hypothetical protein
MGGSRGEVNDRLLNTEACIVSFRLGVTLAEDG